MVPINRPDATVFFADDSIVARKQIEKTLQLMKVNYVSSGQLAGRLGRS